MSLIFRPNGLYESKWNGDLHRDVIKPADTNRIFNYLPEYVVLDEAVTLRDLMNFVRKDEALTEFLRHYSSCFQIEEFNDCLDKKPIIDENGEVEFLEIYWHVETHHYKDSYNVFEFGRIPGFHGKGKRNGEETNFGIEFSPIEETAHLKVVLNEEFLIHHYQEKKQPHFITGEQKYKSSFTLLEVLNAIYWEISFFGGPKENEEFLEEMQERVEEIKDGTCELIPADEVFKRLEEQEPPLPPLELEELEDEE